MFESLGTLILGVIIGVVAAAGGLIWWDRRKNDDAAEDAASDGDQKAQRPIWRPK